MSGIAGFRHAGHSSVPADAAPADARPWLGAALAHRGVGPALIGTAGRGALAAAGHGGDPGGGLGDRARIAMSDGVVVVADARLDDCAAARALAGAPCPRREAAQLIALAYRRWGADCVRFLDGDYAFAVLDTAAGRLFCARDPVGVKPLCFHEADGRLAFASDVRGLLCHPAIRPEPDPDAVAAFLDGDLSDPQGTFYRGIRRLPPGCTLDARNGTLRVARFHYFADTPTAAPASDAEHLEAFREAFTASVRNRMPPDGPVGLSLSGGLDSSAVACEAPRHRQATGQALIAVSRIFPNHPAIDERRYINAVLATGAFESVLVAEEPAAGMARIPALVRHFRQPFDAPGMPFNAVVLDVARSRGAGVLLCGHGGDETISYGTQHITDLVRSGQTRRLLADAPGLVMNMGLRPRTVMRILGNSLRYPRRGVPPDGQQRLAHLQGYAVGRRAHALETLDLVASAYGVEFRFPMMDRRLMELCLSLPGHMKTRRGWTRYLLRRGLDGGLPPRVQWRTGKADFTEFIVDGLRATAPGTIDLLRRNADELREHTDPRLAISQCEILRGGGWIKGTDLFGLMRTMALAHWLDQRPSWQALPPTAVGQPVRKDMDHDIPV